ncbi:MAG TPA: hypothetical protein VD902_04115, partial [Symbiobacteriaceae bacterium]|nr:hypothetical protein [Symbiobacteriaceae bacterium]
MAWGVLFLLLALQWATPALGGAPQSEYGDALGLAGNTVESASVGLSDPRGIGVFTNPLAGFPREGSSFVIMSTGLAESAYLPDTNNQELLRRGGMRDDMSAILQGLSTTAGEDLTQLVLQLRVPGWAKGMAFDFQFFTEEWPDYFGYYFNDSFVAQLGIEPLAVTENGQVSAPGNVVYDA